MLQRSETTASSSLKYRGMKDLIKRLYN
ncbi:hypothetical protein ACNKHS_01210 [Shigella flexneri]